MLKSEILVAPRQFAYQTPGEIVTARVLNPLENPRCTKGKARPAILIERVGARWAIMGLTTQSHFANGSPRIPVPNSTACGLGGHASFLWGTPTWVCALDIGDHIGYADDDLWALVTLH